MKKSSLPPLPEPRAITVSIKVKRSTFAALEKAAGAHSRTKSGLAEAVIEQWLKGEGFLK
jgi:hypothetical protein